MSLSTSASVHETFSRAVRENLQRALKTGEDWDRFKAILRETDARLMAEQAAHARGYRDRMAEAKEIILREEHGIRLDEPLPTWAIRQSDSEMLDQKAHTRVRQDYDRRLAVIRKDELDRYPDLSAEIRARDTPTQAFNRAQNRSHDRSGPNRT